MNKLIVLNHKMNLEYDEVFSYIQTINEIATEHSFIVCPSNLYLNDFVNHCTWGIGAQNISEKLDGNYTGEVSTLQLKSLGVEYSIVGHYERKKYFHEDNKLINKKLIACMEANISPIVCFGETGNIDDILKSLEEILKDVENINFIIFAYEPLKVSENESIETIKEKIEIISNYLYDKYNVKPNLIYGGGITRKDMKEVLEISNLNGIMIGKVSADIEKVKKIIKELEVGK